MNKLDQKFRFNAIQTLWGRWYCGSKVSKEGISEEF